MIWLNERRAQAKQKKERNQINKETNRIDYRLARPIFAVQARTLIYTRREINRAD